MGGGLTWRFFRLENGFNLQTGVASANGRIFGRQAWVGLSSEKWGAVTLGRQYNAAQDSLEPLQVSADTSQYGTHPFDTDDLNNTFRTDNSVKYVTPNFHGLQINSMYGFSNNAGNFAMSRSYSVGASYAGGPWRLGAAYVRLDNPAVDTTGAIPSDNYFTFIKGVTKQQIYGAGGLYDFGKASLGLMYTSTTFRKHLTPTTQHQTFQNAEASIYSYQFTPLLQGGARRDVYRSNRERQAGKLALLADHERLAVLLVEADRRVYRLDLPARERRGCSN